MRHRKAGRHLARTSAHRLALRRNLAQSLFQHGEIRTTWEKAKEIRPFVERLITLARTGTLRARQRVEAALTDRAIIPVDQQEAYENMSDAQRTRVLYSRSGRRHRTGAVPASYNKKKVSFVATSVLHKLFSEIAPGYKDRPGGYTRIVRLAKRRVGDDGRVAVLQLVGTEEAPASGLRKAAPGRRRKRAETRRLFAEGKLESRPRAKKSPKAAAKPADAAPDAGETKTE